MKTFEVWAQLFLCEQDCERVHDFFIDQVGVKAKKIVRNMHITVYHSRRPMPTVRTTDEIVDISLPVAQTRLMTLTPGGENPKAGVRARDHKVGIRVQKNTAAMDEILSFRERLLIHETRDVLGNRSPSSKARNAFGARHFQPHLAILRAGSNIEDDLRLLGKLFRSKFIDLHFDRFLIEFASKEVQAEQGNA